MAGSAAPPSSVLIDAPDEFDRQRALFEAIRPLLQEYSGKWVACMSGQIVDSDPDLPELTDRFFRRYGDAPVYMTQIDQAPLRIRTPFLR